MHLRRSAGDEVARGLACDIVEVDSAVGFGVLHAAQSQPFITPCIGAWPLCVEVEVDAVVDKGLIIRAQCRDRAGAFRINVIKILDALANAERARHVCVFDVGRQPRGTGQAQSRVAVVGQILCAAVGVEARYDVIVRLVALQLVCTALAADGKRQSERVAERADVQLYGRVGLFENELDVPIIAYLLQCP